MKKITGIMTALAFVAVIALSGCQQSGEQKGQAPAPGSAPTQTSTTTPTSPGGAGK